MRIVGSNEFGLIIIPDRGYEWFISDERSLPAHEQWQRSSSYPSKHTPTRIGREAILSIPPEATTRIVSSTLPYESASDQAARWLQEFVLYDSDQHMYAMLGQTCLMELVYGQDAQPRYAYNSFWEATTMTPTPSDYPAA